MTLGPLPYPATSMNARVAGFAQEDRAPRGHRMDNASNGDMLIDAAYRQLFFHTMAADREPFLESQFKNGQINVQQLMRGLCLSERFRRWVYQCNSNYDVATQLVQRLLGREVNGEKEKIARSIVLCQEGLAGLVDALLNSPEYMDAFGVDTVPYQRRRLLSGRPVGNMPFNISLPRYGAYWRDAAVTKWSGGGRVSAAWANGVPPVARKFGLALSIVGSLELVRVFLTVVVAVGSTAGH
ncbi:MAG: phycobilisome Linker polypeptide [Synechococcus sp. SB0662_bin_45]|nr:phycobilisome Linker polypeptide [Synechococcus sp. SB0668_bin_13]MYE21248.1 phycobilisome Linker polypeptide [Synechococcus sp. SB0662_bin_45]